MISGLILAGGAGQRLGNVRKDDLRLGNKPLRLWAFSALAHQVDSILFSVAASRQVEGSNIVVLPDSQDGVTGPAAGLLAGARWTESYGAESMMLSLSVDTPFFPRDFILRAREMMTADVGCVVAQYGGRDYPTNALWNVSRLLEALEPMSRADKGPRLRNVATQIGVVALSYDGEPENPFAGVNSLPDLLALSRRLHRSCETV